MLRRTLRIGAIRLVYFIPMLLIASMLAFVLVELTPADPLFARYGFRNLPAEQEAALRAVYGLDDPLPLRYVVYLRDTLGGNLGVSIGSGQPVTSLIARALPVTLQLAGLSMAAAASMAIILGGLAGARAGGVLDGLTRVNALVWLAAPSYWVAILAVSLFAVHWGLFPSGGYVEPASSVAGWMKSLALPSATLALSTGAILSRVMRQAVLEQMGSEYVLTARALGIRGPRLMLRYVMPNALVTPLTVMGLHLGALLSGAVLVETIFSLPGLGVLLVRGAVGGDFMLVQGVALLVVCLFLAINLLVDMAYAALDPRIRT